MSVPSQDLDFHPSMSWAFFYGIISCDKYLLVLLILVALLTITVYKSFYFKATMRGPSGSMSYVVGSNNSYKPGPGWLNELGRWI